MIHALPLTLALLPCLGPQDAGDSEKPVLPEGPWARGAPVATLVLDGDTGQPLAGLELTRRWASLDLDSPLEACVISSPKQSVDLLRDRSGIEGLRWDRSRGHLLRPNVPEPEHAWTEPCPTTDAAGRTWISIDLAGGLTIPRAVLQSEPDPTGRRRVGERLADGTCRLWPEGELAFRVLDGRGQPLSGVVFGLRDRRDPRMKQLASSSVSDGEVKFRRHVRLPEQLQEEVVCLSPGLEHQSLPSSDARFDGGAWRMDQALRWRPTAARGSNARYLSGPATADRPWTTCSVGIETGDGDVEFVVGPVDRASLELSAWTSRDRFDRWSTTPSGRPAEGVVFPISGEVLGAGGEPLSDARVEIRLRGPYHRSPNESWCFGSPLPDPFQRIVQLDANGRFELRLDPTWRNYEVALGDADLWSALCLSVRWREAANAVEMGWVALVGPTQGGYRDLVVQLAPARPLVTFARGERPLVGAIRLCAAPESHDFDPSMVLELPVEPGLDEQGRHMWAGVLPRMPVQLVGREGEGLKAPHQLHPGITDGF